MHDHVGRQPSRTDVRLSDEHASCQEPMIRTNASFGGHHKQHHDGFITIGGMAPDRVTFARGSRRDGVGRRLPMEDAHRLSPRHRHGSHDPRGSS